MRFSESEAWWARAQRVIPLGTQTFSKSPTQYVQGATPIYLRRGFGSHVWDVDGNEFIDFPMALGPVILGYADLRVNRAVAAQLADGITFTLMHPLEVEVSERIVAMCPGVEAVRFGKSGSDALTAAIRAARALTGRDQVLVSGYHGWHDWFIGTTSRNAGVPEVVASLTRTFPFGDLERLEDALAVGRVAAVVVEPSGAETPADGYLQAVVDLCRRAGARSIFDEVITGFRIAPGGAREKYGVLPDFSCYGKALGNGMPISVVAGQWEVMRVFEDIFFSGTHGGEALSLAAAKVVLETLGDGTVLRAIGSLGARLKQGMTDAVMKHDVAHRVHISGEPARTVVSFPGPDSLVDRSWIQQSFAEDGILFNGSMFVSASHDDIDIDKTLRSFDAALETLASEDVQPLLKGAPVQPVFRKP